MMNKVQRDIMCVLLQALLDKELITQDIHDKSREKILDTLDWPEAFCYARDTAEGTTFAACANLPPQSIASEEPQCTKYSDSSETRLEAKSHAQSIKTEPSTVSGDRKEVQDGHT